MNKKLDVVRADESSSKQKRRLTASIVNDIFSGRSITPRELRQIERSLERASTAKVKLQRAVDLCRAEGLVSQ